MLSFNKTVLAIAAACILMTTAAVALSKYNKALAESKQLVIINKQLHAKNNALGNELSSSEADKRSMLADLKDQEEMFNQYLSTLNAVNEQHTVVQTKLKEVFIYDQANKDWGNTMLPNDVKRVLHDATRPQGNNDNQAGSEAPAHVPP